MAVLFVEFFPCFWEDIDFPIQIATIRMGLSTICLKGSQVDFPNKIGLQSLNIAFIIANRADSDEMQQTTLLWVSSIQRAYSPLSDEFNPLGPKT